MWPFSKKSVAFCSWPIVRTKPITKARGVSISIFINNMQCHLTTLDVYADGIIDCWGCLDLDLFQEKLRRRWAVTVPKKDQALSVSNFGFTRMEEGRWHQTPESLHKEVVKTLSRLNPVQSSWINMGGSDVEVRGKVTYSKFGMTDKKPYIEQQGTAAEIVGDSVPVLRARPDAYELSRLVVYQNGRLQIGETGPFYSFPDVEEMYARGQLSNQVPSGSRIILPGLGEFRAMDKFGSVTPADRIGELKNKLDKLNGSRTSSPFA